MSPQGSSAGRGVPPTPSTMTLSSLEFQIMLKCQATLTAGLLDVCIGRLFALLPLVFLEPLCSTRHPKIVL